jgi:hypothetical protein
MFRPDWPQYSPHHPVLKRNNSIAETFSFVAAEQFDNRAASSYNPATYALDDGQSFSAEKLYDLSPRANYTDPATAACLRS